MKKNRMGLVCYSYPVKNILRIMKLTVFLILLSFVQLLANNSFAQKTKLSVDLKNTSIEMVLLDIENQSNFKFIYNKEKVDVNSQVNIQLKDKSINETLDAIFEGKNVSYSFYGNQVILTNSESESTPSIQQKPISGKVTDSSSVPLPGVTVVLKGTTTGIITDANGNYSISNVPENATLIFSFVGMKKQEVAVGGKTTIDVSMQEETIGIEEVVAIGYGTMKKSDLTGSVVSADIKAFRESPNVSIVQSLQGTVPGLNVGQVTSAGQNPSILIRGQNSFSSSNTAPLLVVDGVIFVGQLIDLNPADIESVDVLKDASSTAV